MNIEIVDFYLNIPNAGHPTISDVLDGSFEWLENNHFWCQRAFPNFEPSELVPGSPVLDDEALDYIKAKCETEVYKLVHRYMRHYNEIYDPQLLYHNNRRVTRLLKFLTMLGYTNLAQVALSFFSMTNNKIREYGTYETREYWVDALKYEREYE